MINKYKQWIKKGLDKGLSDVEVYATNSTNLSIDVYSGKVESNEISKMNIALIKGIYNEKVVQVKIEDYSDENIDRMLDVIIDSASNITAKEPALIFEGSEKYEEIENVIFDFSSIDPQLKVANLIKIEEGIKKNEYTNNVENVSYSETESKTVIINSKGLNLSKHHRYAMIYASGVYKKGKQVKTGLSYQIVKDYNDFDFNKIITDNIDVGTGQLGAESIKSSSYPVVFSNETFGSIIASYAGIFSGEAAFRHLTKLIGKENSSIASSKFNLLDDPFSNDALFKVPFDDEGVATKKRYWIKDGVFTGFSHNLKTAEIFKTESTGNGYTGGISASNLVVERGSKSLEEILSTVNDGIYITNLVGLHAGVETVSGDFSVQASGFHIENGKLARPLDMLVVSGNFFKLLNDIEEIGNNLIFGLYGVGSPAVKIKQLTIAGK